LLNRLASVTTTSTKGLLPLHISHRIGLYKMNIIRPSTIGISPARDNIPAIACLLNRIAPISGASAEGFFPLHGRPTGYGHLAIDQSDGQNSEQERYRTFQFGSSEISFLIKKLYQIMT